MWHGPNMSVLRNFFCRLLPSRIFVAILSNTLPKIENSETIQISGKTWHMLLDTHHFDTWNDDRVWKASTLHFLPMKSNEHRVETVWNSTLLVIVYSLMTYFLCWHTLGAYQYRRVLAHWIIFSTEIAAPLGGDRMARVPVPNGQWIARFCRLPKGPLFAAPERESFGPRFELYLHSVGLKTKFPSTGIGTDQVQMHGIFKSYAHYDHSQPFCRPQIPSIDFVHGAFSCEWCRREPDRPR